MTSETLNNVRILVQEAWAFLVPPTVRVAIALAILLAFTPALTSSDLSVAQSSPSADELLTQLERFKLTSLIPLGSFVLVIVTAFATNKLMFGIGTLIPIEVKIDYSEAVADEPMLRKVWQKNPSLHTPSEVIALAMDTIGIPNPESKIGAEREAARLCVQNKATQENSSFIKFLIIWSVMSASLALWHSGVLQVRVYLSLIAVLAVLVFLLALNFAKDANERKQGLIARLKVTNSLSKNQPVAIDSDQNGFIEDYLHRSGECIHGWWSIAIADPPFLVLFKGYGRLRE